LRELGDNDGGGNGVVKEKGMNNGLIGRRGKGGGDNFTHFCVHCHLEFNSEPTSEVKCNQCQRVTMLHSERRAQLLERVALLTSQKEDRAKRRESFQQYKAAKKAAALRAAAAANTIIKGSPASSSTPSTSSSSLSAGAADNGVNNTPASPSIPSTTNNDTKTASANKKVATSKKASTTDYDAWDFWEPSSDDDDMPPPDTPAFRALALDIDERNARRRQREELAIEEKDKGNEHYKGGRYSDAIHCYDRAIDHNRSEKSFYTNRAAAYIALNRYNDAHKDCNTALEIWEFLESRRSPTKNTVVLKAYLRRATALRYGLLPRFEAIF
jgi:tetratricopeptide (TPR) repeat protein